MVEDKTMTSEETVVLSLRDVHKSFGGIKALDGVDLDLYQNELLALLGDNGAGKSTLIKIISGVYQPDQAEIFLFGKKRRHPLSPKEAAQNGIKTVYQDLALFDVLDVPQNLFMGYPQHRWGFLAFRRMDNRSTEILSELKAGIKSLRRQAKYLSGGQRHAVAIGRTVYVGPEPRIIIMDEPTAGLGVEESQKVLDLLKVLKRKVSIILISHNLNHVFEVADRAVVLRHGRVSGIVQVPDSSIEEIISLMVGK